MTIINSSVLSASNPTILAREISVVPKFIRPLDSSMSDTDMDSKDLKTGLQDIDAYHLQTACKAIGV